MKCPHTIWYRAKYINQYHNYRHHHLSMYIHVMSGRCESWVSVDFYNMYFAHVQSSTDADHSLDEDLDLDNTLFSAFGNITVLLEQKERVEKLIAGSEKPAEELLYLNTVLSTILNSSCTWVSWKFQFCYFSSDGHEMRNHNIQVKPKITDSYTHFCMHVYITMKVQFFSAAVVG